MTQRLLPDPAVQAYRTAFWRVAAGRLDGDSLACSLATAQLMPLVNGGVSAVLIVAVDATVDLLADWADDMGKNPACWAEAAFNFLHAQLTPPQRLILYTAGQTLLALDPTGEAGTPHETCRPWPPAAAVESLTTAAGGRVLADATTVAAQTDGLAEHPAITLCNAAPAVLTHLLWGRSGSDPQRMRDLLAARSRG